MRGGKAFQRRDRGGPRRAVGAGAEVASAAGVAVAFASAAGVGAVAEVASAAGVAVAFAPAVGAVESDVRAVVRAASRVASTAGARRRRARSGVGVRIAAPVIATDWIARAHSVPAQATPSTPRAVGRTVTPPYDHAR